MRTLLVMLALTIAALSGCTDPAEFAGPEFPDGTGTQTGTQAGTGAPGGQPSDGGQANVTNQAPTAELTADVPNGTAPLNVTFLLDGSDPDGDNLTWSLEVNGTSIANGTALPANVTSVFDAGSFNVTLRVSDGVADATSNLTLQVGVAVASAPQEPIVIDGSITGAYLGAPVVGGVGYTGSNAHTFDVTQAATTITVTISFGTTALDLDFDVIAPDGTEAGAAASYNEPTGEIFDSGEPAVVVQDASLTSQVGAWTVNVYPGVAVEGDYTVTVTFS